MAKWHAAIVVTAVVCKEIGKLSRNEVTLNMLRWSQLDLERMQDNPIKWVVVQTI